MTIVQNSISLRRHPDLVLILNTPKGRGVFASASIPAHTVLETCPVLVLDPQENRDHIEKTELFHYTYNWPTPTSTNSKDNTNGTTITNGTNGIHGRNQNKNKTQAVILGLGSMFNHSTMHQNVGWQRDVENQLITYKTLRDIEKGEELCISYGSRLTFIDTDAPEPVDEGDGSQLLGSINIDDDDSDS